MDPRNAPRYRVIPIQSPAAGAEVSIVPDTSAGWLVRGLRFTLLTSAVAGARTVTLAVDDTIAEYVRAPAVATQAASLSRVYSGYPGSASAIAAGPVIPLQMPADGLWLPQGHRLRTITDLIDVGDQYGGISLAVIEFPTGPDTFMWPAVTVFSEESR